MEHTDAIVKALGGSPVFGIRVTSMRDLSSRLREGLPYAALEHVMVRYGIAREEACSALQLPLRTIARRKRAQRLDPGESDCLFRLTRIATLATEVLGTDDKAARWLHRPNRALGNESPLSLLDTDAGARQVEAVLGRIAHGVFS